MLLYIILDEKQTSVAKKKKICYFWTEKYSAQITISEYTEDIVANFFVVTGVYFSSQTMYA